MRQAIAGNIGPRRFDRPGPRAVESFVPVPTEGWDTESPQLPPSRARVFDNWIPHGIQLELRKGHSAHATGISDPVETLMAYNAGVASTLFAAALTSVYDATTTGAVGAAVLTAMGNARFSYTNMTTSGGSFLWICNGSVAPRHWNGSAWATPSLSITTYASTDIAYVYSYKERLYFIFKNTLTFGYLPTQQIAGTIANFPLGAVFNNGGRLVAIGSVSQDGGAGLHDMAVFLTSEGEIAVYQGANPGDSTDWALVGHWDVGEPIGDRPMVNLGADLGIITRNGLVSVLAIMSTGQNAEAVPYLSARISTPFREATALGFTGWDGVFVPSADLLIINSPTSATMAQQFVRHRVTGGWARFTGWNFQCFEVFRGLLYGGRTSGGVSLCLDGYDDAGADITGALATAWDQLKAVGVKTLMEIRPIVTVATRAVLRVIGRTDFRDSPPLPAWPSSTITNALIWGGPGVWGTQLWGGEDASTRQWRAISGDGHSVSIVVEARSNQSRFAFNGFDLRYQQGGQV